MKTALNFSLKKKILSNQDYEIINKHIEDSKLPRDIKKYFKNKHIDKIVSFMIRDKKNDSNKINLILLKRIGVPIIKKNFDKKYLKSFFKKQLIN